MYSNVDFRSENCQKLIISRFAISKFCTANFSICPPNFEKRRLKVRPAKCEMHFHLDPENFTRKY